MCDSSIKRSLLQFRITMQFGSAYVCNILEYTIVHLALTLLLNTWLLALDRNTIHQLTKLLHCKHFQLEEI